MFAPSENTVSMVRDWLVASNISGERIPIQIIKAGSHSMLRLKKPKLCYIPSTTSMSIKLLEKSM
jgi:hypothetical protein